MCGVCTLLHLSAPIMLLLIDLLSTKPQSVQQYQQQAAAALQGRSRVPVFSGARVMGDGAVVKMAVVVMVMSDGDGGGRKKHD